MNTPSPRLSEVDFAPSRRRIPRRASALVIAIAAVLLVAPPAVNGGCYVEEDYYAEVCASIWYNNSRCIDSTRVDWMAQLPDDMLVSELSIPGTHESHTFSGCPDLLPGWVPECVTCQAIPFDQQLNAGIRAVDVRVRQHHDSMPLYHGICYQFSSLDTCEVDTDSYGPCGCGGILPACVQFLQEHPTETILVRFRQVCPLMVAGVIDVYLTCCDNTSSFTEAVELWLEAYADGYVYQWPYDECGGVPTLGEVRGKIVVLQDFNGDYEVGAFEGWPDDRQNWWWTRSMTTYNLPTPVDRGLAVINGLRGELFTFTMDGVRLERAEQHDTDATYTSVCSGEFFTSEPTQIAVTACHLNELQLYSWNDLTTPSHVYPTGDFPVSARTVDFNDDGLLDIVVANCGHGSIDPGTVRLFRNTGTGFEWEDLSIGSKVWGVSVANLNGDSFPDLVTTQYSFAAEATRLSAWINNGGTSLDLYYTLYTASSEHIYQDAVAADFNDNGLDDVVLAHIENNGGMLSLFQNSGSTLVPVQHIDLPSYPTGLAAADIDNDGDSDIIVGGNGGVVSYLNYGDFTFPENRGVKGSRYPYPVIAEDFDGDSDIDVAAVEYGPTVEGEALLGRNRVSIARNEDGGETWCPGKLLGPYWPNLLMQDDYEVIDHNTKWNAVQEFMDLADGSLPMDELCVNHLSGIEWGITNCDQTPNWIAYDMNWRMLNRMKWKLNLLPSRPRYGVIMADYPGPGLIDVVIGSNKFGGNHETGEFFGPISELPGVNRGEAVWGDYDGDGDLDMLLIGLAFGDLHYASVFRNDDGSFNDIGAGLPGVEDGSAAWGDYDNDGDLDILLTGYAPSVLSSIARVYRNDDGTFVHVEAGLQAVSDGSVAWGDYDNDGDLDILLSGDTGSDYISRIYRNVGGSFYDTVAGLPGLSTSSVAWGDYDSDGDLDILLTGLAEGGRPCYGGIFRNDEGDFSDIGAELLDVQDGSVAWGDYDSDGDLDILLAGYAPDLSRSITRVFRNDAGVFEDVGAGLPGVSHGSVAWGDYDNDGDLDAILNGSTQITVDWEEVGVETWRISRIYRNDGGVFARDYTWLASTSNGSAAWGDYEGDGDLDIAIIGEYHFHVASVHQVNWELSRCSAVYENMCSIPNTPPAVPANLISGVADSVVTFSWDAATDPETPSAGLSYNLRVGTTPGGSEIMSPMADGADGHRRVPRLGNVQQRTSWALTLPPGTYYWSVQAIDSAFAGSPFAEEQIVVDTPVENSFYASFVDVAGSVRLRWSLSSYPGGEGLLVYRATSVDGHYSCITSEPLPGAGYGSYVDDTAWPGATFWYELRVLLESGEELLATDIRASVSVPGSLAAGIRYVSPNPATERATIGYSLPTGWRSARLSVHDVTGRVVRRLDPANGAEGWVTVEWDGSSGSGDRVASGVYFVRLVVDGNTASKRLIILR